MRRLFVCVIVALVGCLALADSQVPFKLTASATTDAPVFSGTHMFLSASGGGSASHMGTITFVAPHDFDLANGTYVSDAFVKASNGDILHIVTLGQFINAVDSIGVWTVVGGTGRFAGATGSGTSLNLTFGLTITYTGTVSTVGSIDG